MLQPQIKTLKAAVDKRKKQLDSLNKRINDIADRLFADFSKRVGISSIREFQETHEAAMDKMDEDKAELEGQVGGVYSS